VGRAAGLEQNGGRLTLSEELEKSGPRKPMALGDSPRVVGNSDLKHSLGNIH
jgi:hypothetical protein